MRFYNYKWLMLFLAGIVIFSACEKEEFFERTRLFRPVLQEDLMAEGNSIIVNLGDIKSAISYTFEVSRDSFQTTEYTFETDTNYVVINEEVLGGEELFWNTLYQVRVTAHAEDPEYDSRVSDLGSVRTERFPSILNIPGVGDVIDAAARVTWIVSGAPVTKIRVFTPDDLQLRNPLSERDVTADEQSAGLAIVEGLDPLTSYQIAIYSGAAGEELRGWETYTTLAAAIDRNDPNVIDLTASTDSNAVINAVGTAADGNIILLRKGAFYFLPSDPLDKSITIRGAQGFGAEKAVLFTTGNWNIANGTTIDHIRFVDVEVRGEDIGGDYVFNPNNDSQTTINELTFDNCILSHFRGIIRMRGNMVLRNFNIENSVVHHIGGYGIFTTDTDGEGGAMIENILLRNSTFSKVNSFMTSRQNSQSLVIDGCTFNEFAVSDGIFFRWRGEDGVRSNVMGGITITNSIFGHAWDEGGTGNKAVRGIYDGLEATNFSIVNTYATSDFAFTAGTEIPGFPALQYNGTAADLWVAPYDGLDFHFKDNGFAGRFDAGDPRWRAQL